ncbi:hypothetical protein CY34DRAFT_18790 [Suillus luteus UH-Slu-Lm8-n1]|uniref:Uncharacterized protein n=1 Tax=Suillus luteus UH-Slu-Lm8-n1 TaxID=930992 RepID=A0A0D0AF08_9AGAM|nr:hypothetical protein CY34DRAFT_18790 [Suillus luteus UH-Slu-Lm8-n1]
MMLVHSLLIGHLTNLAPPTSVPTPPSAVGPPREPTPPAVPPPAKKAADAPSKAPHLHRKILVHHQLPLYHQLFLHPAHTPGPATTTGYFDLSFPRASSPLDEHVDAGANVWADNVSTSPAPAPASVPTLEFDPLDNRPAASKAAKPNSRPRGASVSSAQLPLSELIALPPPSQIDAPSLTSSQHARDFAILPGSYPDVLKTVAVLLCHR